MELLYLYHSKSIQSLLKRYRFSSPVKGECSKSGLCVKLTSHLHRVTKVIMSEAIVLLPYWPSWRGQGETSLFAVYHACCKTLPIHPP